MILDIDVTRVIHLARLAIDELHIAQHGAGAGAKDHVNPSVKIFFWNVEPEPVGLAPFMGYILRGVELEVFLRDHCCLLLF